MYKNYKCVDTGNRYKIWAMSSGLFSIKEQFGDYAEYVFDCIPSTVFLEEVRHEN